MVAVLSVAQVHQRLGGFRAGGGFDGHRGFGFLAGGQGHRDREGQGEGFEGTKGHVRLQARVGRFGLERGAVDVAADARFWTFDRRGA